MLYIVKSTKSAIRPRGTPPTSVVKRRISFVSPPVCSNLTALIHHILEAPLANRTDSSQPEVTDVRTADL